VCYISLRSRRLSSSLVSRISSALRTWKKTSFTQCFRLADCLAGHIFGRFRTKRAGKGRTLIKNYFPPLIPLPVILKFSKSKKYYYFLTDNSSVFPKPKFLQKVKITGGQNLFPQRSNFSSGLAEKFCKELATLVLLSHQSFAAMSLAVLRIRDVYPGSRILIFTHPGSRIQKQQ
jgi:hypothetical protein